MRTLGLSTSAAVGAAERLSFLAMSFDRAAGDETVPLHQRVEFARRANWLRIDARLTQMGNGGLATGMIAAASRPFDALLSSFKLDLLLRHYSTQTTVREGKEFLSRNKQPTDAPCVLIIGASHGMKGLRPPQV